MLDANTKGPGEGWRPVARVDLARIVRNARRLQQAAGGRGLLAVVKANAYGHGAVPVARALEAAGVAGFCVATLAEGLELRRAGVMAPIQLLLGLDPADLPAAAAAGLDLTVVSAAHLQALAPGLAQHPAGLHLELETGIGRSGILRADLGGCLDTLRALAPAVKGAMTHFACAEDDDAFTAAQRRAFQEALGTLRAGGVAPAMVHQAASAGCLRGPLDGDTHVRCGIALYGLCQVPEAAGFEPALELSAPVARVARIPAGTPVGYGATWRAPGPATLASLACGYADGYPRALANRARAGFQGGVHPVVGRISMDIITVALPAEARIQPGDEVVLLSRRPEDPHSVAATADLLGTITYEVTCALNRRVARVPA